MTRHTSLLSLAVLGFATAVSASCQVPAIGPGATLPSSLATPQGGIVRDVSGAAAIPVPVTLTPAIQLFQEFKPSDVKFDVADLMEVLRDRRHEGWVLAAYPDPKTGRPLIGAGFSLDLPVREHPQRDPLNPHVFLEPASAELWQAAGLEPERLQTILRDYQGRLDTWNTRQFRRQIKTLPAQISDREANQLLRIAAIQSIYNARAYCRNFDQLSGSQQMAVSQLVYQMGVNLEQFSQFLGLINSEGGPPQGNGAYWKSVQQSLTQSQWARLYRSRAIAVIAMLDPRYDENPRTAERRVGLTLRPAVIHRRHARTELASNRKSSGPHGARKTRRARSRRKA